MANTTAIRTVFMRQYKKFLKLFYHKAYVWQFLEANGELEMFFEAQERVRDMIQDYEDILSRSCEQEQLTNASATLTGAHLLMAQRQRDREAAGEGGGDAGGAAAAA